MGKGEGGKWGEKSKQGRVQDEGCTTVRAGA